MAEDDDVQYIGVKHGQPGELTSEEMSESGMIWRGNMVNPPSTMAGQQIQNRISMFANKFVQFWTEVTGHAGLPMHKVLQSPIGMLHPSETAMAMPPPVKVEHSPDVWEAAFMSLVERLGDQHKGGLSEGGRMAIWMTQPEVTGLAFLRETPRAKEKEALAALRADSGMPDITFEQAALESDEQVRTAFALYIAHAIMYTEALRPGTSALRQTANIHSGEMKIAREKFRNVVRLDDGRLGLCSAEEALRRQKRRVDAVVRNIAPSYPVGVGAYRAVPLTAVL